MQFDRLHNIYEALEECGPSPKMHTRTSVCMTSMAVWHWADYFVCLPFCIGKIKMQPRPFSEVCDENGVDRWAVLYEQWLYD